MLSRTKKRRKFKDSFKNCIDGLRFININEDNFKREILLGIITLVLSYLLKIDKNRIYNHNYSNWTSISK